jgi:hypothetical protein
MATFTLIDRPRMGDEVWVPDRGPNAPVEVGDQRLTVDRVLVDRRGRQRGTVSIRGTVIQTFPPPIDDAVLAFEATNNLEKGVINTQVVIRFGDVVTTGVTFAIVGGTRKYKKAHGTVTAKIVNSIAHFTFRVL